MKPSVGRIVHYVSFGTPGGEYRSECRAAIISGLGEPLTYPVHGDGVDDLGEDDAQLVDLCVLNPDGFLFREGVPQDERPISILEAGENGTRQGGTWHWPERVEG
jgi:hypothetical protein